MDISDRGMQHKCSALPACAFHKVKRSTLALLATLTLGTLWVTSFKPNNVVTPDLVEPFNITCGFNESGGLLSHPCTMWNWKLEHEAAYFSAQLASEVAFMEGTELRYDDTNVLRVIEDSTFYYSFNWHPTITCDQEERIGLLGDGGKWVCNPRKIKPPCLVFSFGSYNEFGFEKDLQALSKCEIHTFDPTIGDAPTNLPNGVFFHPYGLVGAEDSNRPAYKSWDNILKELDHDPSTTYIDILKMDIEGSEWEMLFMNLEAGKLDNVRQLLVEFHYYPPHFELRDKSMLDMFLLLRRHNFVQFHREVNGWHRCCMEFSFLRLSGLYPLEPLPTDTRTAADWAMSEENRTNIIKCVG